MSKTFDKVSFSEKYAHSVTEKQFVDHFVKQGIWIWVTPEEREKRLKEVYNELTKKEEPAKEPAENKKSK